MAWLKSFSSVERWNFSSSNNIAYQGSKLRRSCLCAFQTQQGTCRASLQILLMLPCPEVLRCFSYFWSVRILLILESRDPRRLSLRQKNHYSVLQKKKTKNKWTCLMWWCFFFVLLSEPNFVQHHFSDFFYNFGRLPLKAEQLPLGTLPIVIGTALLF